MEPFSSDIPVDMLDHSQNEDLCFYIEQPVHMAKFLGIEVICSILPATDQEFKTFTLKQFGLVVSPVVQDILGVSAENWAKS